MDAIYQVLSTFITIYWFCLIIWVLLSWLPMLSPQLAYNSTLVSVRRFLDSVVEPYVRLFRFIPPVRIGAMLLDLSVLVAIIAFSIGSNLLLDLIPRG